LHLHKLNFEMRERIAGMIAITSKGHAHGVEPQECVVKRGSRIKVMGVMGVLVGMHDMNVSKRVPLSFKIREKIAGMIAIANKGPAHGAARPECAVRKGSVIKAMDVMVLLVEVHDTNAS